MKRNISGVILLQEGNGRGRKGRRREGRREEGGGRERGERGGEGGQGRTPHREILATPIKHTTK